MRLLIAYHGAPFHGWQIQSSVETVEGALTDAVAQLLGRRVKVQGASRTDAGVHALGQVACFEDGGRHTPEVYVRALNRLTPRGIAVVHADRSVGPFHPRHDARGKQYRYRIQEGYAVSPLLADRTWHHAGQLDVAAMDEAAGALVGEHDFSSFRAAGCDAASPVRVIRRVRVRRVDEGPLGRVVEVEIAGSAFLKYMVRNIVGTLITVGRGRRPAEWVGEVLRARDRGAAGVTAPAHGLVLERIHYPLQPFPAAPILG